MKVVFLKNGREHKKGEIKDVAEGYFRNFLLPKGLAVIATEINVAKIKKELNKKNKEVSGNLNEARKLAQIIEGSKIEIVVKANEAGKLYAAINSRDILSALTKQGVNVADAKVIFDSHIKEPGNYRVKIDLNYGIISEINVLISV